MQTAIRISLSQITAEAWALNLECLSLNPASTPCYIIWGKLLNVSDNVFFLSHKMGTIVIPNSGLLLRLTEIMQVKNLV